MTGHALQNPGVLILHFALDAPMAPRFVRFCRWNRPARCRSRAISRCQQPQRLENLPADPFSQVFTREYFQRLAKQDEPRIGILGSRARFSLQRQFQADAKQRGGRRNRPKELHIAGQSGIMAQQVAQPHMPGVVA